MASVIDLSRYQSGISLAAIKRDGHAAVIVKATQGASYTSPTLAAQVAAARAAGLPVGCYHYCDGSDATAQARHFLDVAGPLIHRGTEPLIFDFEGTSATHAGLDVMRRVVRAAGHRTATYTGGYWDTGGSSTCRECASDPLWLAAYRSTQPAPKRPWTRIALWQRTDSARVTGWGAGVDMSTTDDLSALFGNAPSPAPKPAPTPKRRPKMIVFTHAGGIYLFTGSKVVGITNVGYVNKLIGAGAAVDIGVIDDGQWSEFQRASA